MPVVYRLAKRRHPPFDGTGAALVGGRWNSPGRPVIYAADHYANAVLEALAHAGRVALPGPHHAVPIQIPDDVAVEEFDPALHPDWEIEGSAVARAFGDRWLAEQRTAVLRVPSVPGRPVEWNLLINPAHADTASIVPGQPFDVPWDDRLFGAR